jgi:hypothetical protein
MFAASKTKRAVSAVNTDPYFPYVPLLLETTTTNGQQNNTFLDSSTNNFTLTRSGTPTQGSVTPYWPDGYWSNYFSSSYLSVADSASLRFGSGNFTIEAWVFRTASGATHTIACKGSSTGPTGWVFQISSANKLVFIDTSTSITGTTSLAANTWYYVAVVRAGTGASQTTLYVNGASDGTGTSATTFSQTDALRIGTDRSAANGFAGYVSNLRLSNTNLTISSTPTTPLTALASTIFLSCGYNRFIDGSSLASAITVGSGTPQVQAFQPFSPTASYTTALYGGSMFGSTGTTTGVVVPDNAAFTCAGDFTSEFWYYPLASSSFLVVMGFYDGTFQPWSIVHDTNNFTIYVSSNFSSWNIANGTVLGAVVYGQWNHLAVVRSGTSTGNLKFYINGSLATSVTYTGTIDPTQGLRFYCSSGGAYSSNARFVNGTAVYTAAFTPPTVPLTAITNTSLLLNFTNAGIYDAAVQNNAITVGDAQSSTTQSKWSPTSMKYDGTGDWLTAIDNPQLQLGTGDFTIEGWVYLSAISVAYGIISKGTATTGWSVNVTALNKLQFSYTASVLTGATSLATGTWYYFAVVRSGSATGNLKIYLNGTADATSGGAVTDNFNQTSILYVGADRIGTSALNGYLQDIRITKYARTITTPTAAFPTR